LDQSISHLEKAVALEPDNEQAQFNLSNALFQKKQYDSALIHAQKTITLNPGHEKANQLAGIILYEQGQLNQALIYFNAALTINPKSTAAHHYKGIIFLRQKRTDKALASFKKALVHDPDNQETRQLVQHIEAKLTTEEQHLLQELEKNPNNDGLRVQLGKIYQAQNLSGKAIEQYKLVIRQHPESIETLYCLASTYADQGEYSIAISCIEQAMSYQPDNPAHDYNMACLFARQNQTSAAIEWLKKAMDKGYENWDKIQMDEDLQSIRNTSGFKRLIENR
jgi:tetratricopeptide (TPR) repeat protein